MDADNMDNNEEEDDGNPQLPPLDIAALLALNEQNLPQQNNNVDVNVALSPAMNDLDLQPVDQAPADNHDYTSPSATTSNHPNADFTLQGHGYTDIPLSDTLQDIAPSSPFGGMPPLPPLPVPVLPGQQPPAADDPRRGEVQQRVRRGEDRTPASTPRVNRRARRNEEEPAPAPQEEEQPPAQGEVEGVPQGDVEDVALGEEEPAPAPQEEEPAPPQHLNDAIAAVNNNTRVPAPGLYGGVETSGRQIFEIIDKCVVGRSLRHYSRVQATVNDLCEEDEPDDTGVRYATEYGDLEVVDRDLLREVTQTRMNASLPEGVPHMDFTSNQSKKDTFDKQCLRMMLRRVSPPNSNPIIYRNKNDIFGYNNADGPIFRRGNSEVIRNRPWPTRNVRNVATEQRNAVLRAYFDIEANQDRWEVHFPPEWRNPPAN